MDKILGNTVLGVIEKMHHTFAKLFDRGKKTIVPHMFIKLLAKHLVEFVNNLIQERYIPHTIDINIKISSKTHF
jgi:hypothetical protein